jgi:hypothetical protein
MKPTEQELEKLRFYAKYYNKEKQFVWLRKDEKGYYIEYAFTEGAPHDNRCLSWYDSYQENAYRKNGWLKDSRTDKPLPIERQQEILANIRKKREDRIGQIFRLTSFTCGYEENTESALKHAEECWKEFHSDEDGNLLEPFVPEDHICKVGSPAKACNYVQHKKKCPWTYEEPVKCACWKLDEIDMPENVSIPIEIAMQFSELLIKK